MQTEKVGHCLVCSMFFHPFFFSSLSCTSFDFSFHFLFFFPLVARPWTASPSPSHPFPGPPSALEPHACGPLSTALRRPDPGPLSAKTKKCEEFEKTLVGVRKTLQRQKTCCPFSDPIPQDILHVAPVEQFSFGLRRVHPEHQKRQPWCCRWPFKDDSRTLEADPGVGVGDCWLDQKSLMTNLCCCEWGVSLLSGHRVRGPRLEVGGESIARQIAPAVQEATSPFQHALTTNAGGECVAHAMQSLTDPDSRATMLSVGGIGAFDVISRAATADSAPFCAPVLF